MSQLVSVIAIATAIAQVTLTDRSRRRKLISGMLIGILTLFVLGAWPLAQLLGSSLWFMLIWWGGSTLLCLFLVMLALYDALSVVKEERTKMGLRKEEDLNE